MSVERVTREEHILGVLATQGSITVSDLARDLSVSEVTVRSDLRTLEYRGLLARTRGGATATSLRTVLERQAVHDAQKQRIAAAAAALVGDGDRIMVEAGTTTALIPRFLTDVRDVQIVTNSTLVFSYARQNPHLTVILCGGEYHRRTESLVGPTAVRTLGEYNVRLAFVGTDGFTPDRGLTTEFEQGAQVIAAMHARAEETWLVADSSKYGHAGFVSVLTLDQVAGVITDSDLPPESQQALAASAPIVRIV